METAIRKHFDTLYVEDADVRYEAFKHIMEVTNKPVSWIYEVWIELLKLLKNKNNHVRTIAVQLLSNLAKSDSENRLLNDFDQMITVTKDEKFVTARHSLQCLWKVAVVKSEFREMVLAQLTKRYNGAMQEKNGTLIRYDIIEVFRKAFDVNQDSSFKNIALELIESEPDLKYRKKYAGLWKK